MQPKLFGNLRLHEYAEALKKFSADRKAPLADQFHAIVDVWGRNKPQENLANALVVMNTVAKDDKLVGVEHLRAFLAARSGEPQPVSMQGDPVHPGAAGQLIMAAALLQALDAPGLVSRAVLAADGKVVEAKACTINNVQASGGKLSFDRLDESAAFPIPDEARGAPAVSGDLTTQPIHVASRRPCREGIQTERRRRCPGRREWQAVG